ncbi:MAG: deoxyribodipyrimidine photo-lyase [Streptosporangiaceae bacterium]
MAQSHAPTLAGSEVHPAIAAPPNRARFLAESLADLRASLRERGGDLVIRDGDPAAEVIALAGQTKASPATPARS